MRKKTADTLKSEDKEVSLDDGVQRHGRNKSKPKTAKVSNPTPFGLFKKRVAVACQGLPVIALMAAIYSDSDGSAVYLHALWLTGTIGTLGMFNLFFAKME